MNYLDLEDRLYTSTEVARILGVSLRSVYRYLEDGKLDAEIKTATGRHRFTKQNILEFLSPQVSRRVVEPSNVTPVSPADSHVVVDLEQEEKFEPIKSRELVSEKLTPIVEDFEEDDEDDEETDFYPSPKVASSKTEEVPTFVPSVSAFNDDENINEDASVSSKSSSPSSHSQTDEAEEEVDWLAKFRAAAEKYKAEVKAAEVEDIPAQVPHEPVTRKHTTEVPSVSAIAQEPVIEEISRPKTDVYYYTSTVGGLKDIAQNLDKSAQKASLDYAFTMDAGLSLHKPIRPFSLIHAYVRSEDLLFFEKILGLKNATKEDAQLCLIASDDDEVFYSSKEMHGLKVVSNTQLKADLTSEGKADLAKEL